MARINLLPWREKLRKEREKQFYLIVGAVVATTLSIMVVIHITINNLIGAQEIRNQFLTQQISNLDQQIAAIQSLETEKTRLLNRMNVIQQLQTSRPEIVHLYEEIVTALPDGSYLLKLEHEKGVIKIEGVAESNARISSFMRNLDDSSWLQDPELIVINANTKEYPNASWFSLSVKRTPQVPQ